MHKLNNLVADIKKLKKWVLERYYDVMQRDVNE